MLLHLLRILWKFLLLEDFLIDEDWLFFPDLDLDLDLDFDIDFLALDRLFWELSISSMSTWVAIFIFLFISRLLTLFTNVWFSIEVLRACEWLRFLRLFLDC